MNIAPITRPTLEESYESATNASNLKVKAEERGDVDVLIAAGWSDSRLGLALMRLRSEWAGAEKPRHISKEAVKLMAKENGIEYARASEMAGAWFSNELALFLLKLKTLKEVTSQMNVRADKKGLSLSAVGPVILWWLDQTCHHCQGRGKAVIPGTPSLSLKGCSHCHGTGKAPIKYGSTGRYLAAQMDASLNSAKASLRTRFTHQKIN